MGVLHGNPFLIASGTPTEPTFPLQRSLRLRASASASLSRTFTTPTNQAKWTWSGWVKRGTLGSLVRLMSSGTTASDTTTTTVYFTSSDTIAFSGGTTNFRISNQVFRDTSAWYHIVIAVDTTQAVEANKILIYVNGVQITFATTNAITTCAFNSAQTAYIGTFTSAQYFDGYLAEVTFVDGQALTPLSFGGYNPGTNVWEVRKYTGSYGTNGFYLPFTDNTSATHLGLSTATSPETNTFWTAVGSAALNTTTKKFGAGSVFFPGSTSRLDGGTTLLSDLNGVDWTIEGWIYPTALAAAFSDILGSNSAGQTTSVSIRTGTGVSTNKIAMGDWGTGASFSTITSTSTVPTNQWTHYAFTKQGTTLRCFFNGTLEATITSANTTLPSFTCSMGNRGNGDLPFTGYMDDVRITKGIARYTSSFTAPTAGYTLTGETHPVTMLMDFDSSITVGQRMEIWNLSGISVASGITYDSMLDVPTNSGSTNANFATLNPLTRQAGSLTLTDGNLNTTRLSAGWARQIGTIGMSSGKWYFEVAPQNNTTSQLIGVGQESSDISNFPGAEATSWGFYTNNGTKYNNGTATAYGTYTPPQIVGVAVDMDAGKIWFSNGATWQASGDPAAGTNPAFSGLTGTVFPQVALFNASTQAIINFGQRPFTHTPPSGFKTLNTFNLPEPTIPRGDKYFEQFLYTGNGGGQQVGEIQKPASLFNLDRSLRFRASNSAYLNRTWGTPTDGRKFTCSFWLKRGLLSGAYQPFGGGTAAANAGGLQFLSSDALNFYWENGTNCNLVTTNVYKDPSLWYHIVVIQDTTQATAGNRLQIYVNGILQTLTGTYPAQNASATFNAATVPFGIMAGRTTSFSLFTDGYLGDFYWIDGQANAATSFGAFDGNNYWTPKAYTGTYGTNGFHLEFEDFSNNTATTIGKDTSGNANNWTPNGISVTAGVTDDSMLDVPTLTSATQANFCTLNPLNSPNHTLSNGNLTTVSPVSLAGSAKGTIQIPDTGKWYWEFYPSTNGDQSYSGIEGTSSSVFYYGFNGNKYVNGAATAYGATYTGGDVIGVAVDSDAATVTFYKNNTSQGAISFTIAGANLVASLQDANTGVAVTFNINFGQRPFSYTPPTGYKALNSFNVAEVVGDVEFPDFVWIKSRNATADHTLFNSVTGVGKYSRTNSNLPTATDVNSLLQFNKNGILLGNSTAVNTLNTTYVANAWKAAESTTTNTAGSVTSQVRANQVSGISIATFTTPASGNFTVGHGLGKTPSMVILKNTSGTDNYYVYNKNFAAPATYYLQLNTTGVILSSASLWGSTLPTSSVITLGTGGGIAANATGILYSFTDVEGFSKFGSYISNNAADGPFVYTGFRPRWLMVKRAMVTAGAAGWFMYDAARNTYNVMDKYLFAEGTAGENTLAVFDFTSNGFKIRSNNVHVNTTAGDSYIYMAFAENPFKYALAR
jgi:hypothetical protein